jgi:outer membrane protein TolC
MGKIKYIIIVLLLSAVKPCIGQEDVYLSLDDYLETAAKNNPGIKAHFNQYLAALEKVPQAGALPDPLATFGYFIKPMELSGGNQTADMQLMQMFPWFGTLKVSKDEASLMAKAEYEAFIAAKAELFYKVKTGWYQLMKFDREIALVSENIEMLESLEKLVLIKFQSPVTDVSTPAMPGTNLVSSASTGAVNNSEGGMGGMNNPQGSANPMVTGSASTGSMSSGMNSSTTGLQDVFRARMEILEQQNKLALLHDQRKTSEEVFNALLNRNLNTPVQISDSLSAQPLPANISAIADTILINNPMLAMLENESGAYGFMEMKAKKMGFPMLGIGLNYMFIQERDGNPSMMNGNDMIMPMVSVSIPVYRKKYSAMQSEARLMQESVNQQIIDLRNNLMVQYRQLVQGLADAGRRIELYKEQEDLARRTTSLLLSGFTTTGNNYEEVLRMQLRVIDYGFKHIEAIVDYNTSAAMAEKLMNSLKY